MPHLPEATPVAGDPSPPDRDKVQADVDTGLSRLQKGITDLSLQVASTPELKQTRDFPPEILRAIFIHCIDPTASPSPQRAPLLLCRICTKWRAVATSTWELWAIARFRNVQMRDLDVLEERWLSRAGDMPLQVYLDEDLAGNFLERFGSRIGSLSIQISWYRIGSVAKPASMPLLESVTFRQGMRGARFPVDLLEDAPRLRRVVMDHIRYHIEPTSTMVRWSQLTEIAITGRYQTIWWLERVLRPCSSLIKCSVLLRGLSPNVTDPRVLHHPHMRFLSITTQGSTGDIERMLRLWSVPSLETLVVAYSPPSKHFPLWRRIPALDNLFSLRNLELLHVGTLNFREVTLFTTVPQLVRLVVACTGDIPPALLGALANDEGPVLPALEHLELRGTADAGSICGNVKRLLESRRGPAEEGITAQLKSARFSFRYHPGPAVNDADFMEALKRFRKEGLFVKWELSPIRRSDIAGKVVTTNVL